MFASNYACKSGFDGLIEVLGDIKNGCYFMYSIDVALPFEISEESKDSIGVGILELILHHLNIQNRLQFYMRRAAFP